MSARNTLASMSACALLSLALAGCSGGSSQAPPPPPPACAAIGASCSSPGACCSGSCTLGTCDCSPLAVTCKTSNDCCEGFSPRKCSGATCVTGCRANGDVCTIGFDCCTGVCDATSHCAPPCLPSGSGCTSSSQCCAYYGCPAGTCSLSCKLPPSACASGNECCSGNGCRAGSCQSGACGTLGQYCDTIADCCSFAASGKNYFCDHTGGGQHGVCNLEQPFQACTTSADCAGSYPCRGGYCHYTDASRNDGWTCLDGLECKSGICAGAAAPTPGTCCSGSGTSCVAGSGATACCAPLACTGAAGAQTCGACLDPVNSGTGHPYQCSTYSQCCQNAGLACETATGTCCKQNGTSCTAGSQCCSGEACGNVTTYKGTAANVCCGAFQGWCGLGDPCCDGLVCSNAGQAYPATCLKAPGQPCQATAECTDLAGCKIATPPTGTCCLHEIGTCNQNSDCCTGICDPASKGCQYAPPYGQCLTNGDCQWKLNTSFTGTRCGGSASVGALHCCPAPGQTCKTAGDCCEATDSCLPAVDPTAAGTTAPVCCRAVQQSCAQDYECCTGACGYRGTPGSFCCAYPYMTSFTCASNADCCGGTGTTPSTLCNASNKCCFTAGQNVGAANAPQCCSGRVDSFGSCR